MSQSSLFDNQKVERTPSGSSKRPTYKFQFDKYYGCPRQVKTGEVDWQAYITASKDSTDLNQIIERAKNGNDAGLYVRNGEFCDVTQLPNNIRDLSKFSDKLKDSFDAFPAEVRALFGDDYSQFVNKTLNGSSNKILSDYASKKIEAAKVKEVKPDEK